MQPAPRKVVDNRLVVGREWRCRRQIDVGCFRPQWVGLAADAQQPFRLGVPGPHFVVGDGPFLGHSGIARGVEILPR